MDADRCKLTGGEVSCLGSAVGIGDIIGSGEVSFFLAFVPFPNTPLKMFKRKPFFSSFTLIALALLLKTVLSDPRDGGVSTLITSFSI